MHLIPTGNFLRDLGEVEKRITTQSRDRQTAERFGTEVATMMKRRSLAQPVQMAVACVGQRARHLVMRNKAGWARVPTSPQKFILVDPRGCVLTDLDGKEIPPPIGVSLPPLITRSSGTIKNAFVPRVTVNEGIVTHIYADDRAIRQSGSATESKAKLIYSRSIADTDFSSAMPTALWGACWQRPQTCSRTFKPSTRSETIISMQVTSGNSRQLT